MVNNNNKISPFIHFYHHQHLYVGISPELYVMVKSDEWKKLKFGR